MQYGRHGWVGGSGPAMPASVEDDEDGVVELVPSASAAGSMLTQMTTRSRMRLMAFALTSSLTLGLTGWGHQGSGGFRGPFEAGGHSERRQ